MKPARIFITYTGEYIYFDYDKIEEADEAWDNLPEEEKQRIINEFKKQVRGINEG
jgi:hypothetical protein